VFEARRFGVAVLTAVIFLVGSAPANAATKATRKPAKSSCTKRVTPTRLGKLDAGVVPVSGTRLVMNEKYTAFTIEVPGRAKGLGPFVGTSPKFIGDGSRILYTRGPLIRGVHADGSGDTSIACGFNPSTTADGDSIFFGGVNGLDRSFRLDRKAAKATIVSDTGGSIAVSPDETLLAFDEYLGSKRVVKVLDLLKAPAEPRPVSEARPLFEMSLDGFGATEAISWSSDSKFVFAGLIIDPCCTNPLDRYFRISVEPPGAGAQISFDESYAQRAADRTSIP
jgi:hypothetical protein